MVNVVHRRVLDADPSDVGRLLDTLGSADDRLWPREQWPALELDGPLAAGAAGGHGPVCYTVVAYEPGRRVRFRFSAPEGFLGHHWFVADPMEAGVTMLSHHLVMRAVGPARVTWPLFYRPLHDALIEDALDTAEQNLGTGPDQPAAWGGATRALRSLAAVG